MCASSLPVPSPPLCHHLSRVHLCSCSSSLRGREPVSAPWIQSLPCTSSLLPKTGLPSSFQLGSAIGENRQEMTKEAGEVGCLYPAPSPQVGCDFLPKAASPLHTATLSCQATAPFQGLWVMLTSVASTRSLHHPLRVSLHPLLSFVNCPFLKLLHSPSGYPVCLGP